MSAAGWSRTARNNENNKDAAAIRPPRPYCFVSYEPTTTSSEALSFSTWNDVDDSSAPCASVTVTVTENRRVALS